MKHWKFELVYRTPHGEQVERPVFRGQTTVAAWKRAMTYAHTGLPTTWTLVSITNLGEH